MKLRRKKVLVLCDVSEPIPPESNPSDYIKDESWETENDVVTTLKRLGHQVSILPVYDDLHIITDYVKNNSVDIIFNLAESFHDERKYEPHLAAYLDLLGLCYTGASPSSLMLCKNKALTKKILSFHRIRVPHFQVSTQQRPLKEIKHLKYPLFVKPLGQEGSDGISQESFVENEKDGLDRINFIHSKLNRDAIVEEYIEGRELYVGLMGRQRVMVFQPRELHFSKVPKGTPKFATYYAKWNAAYRKRWGIRTGKPKSLPEGVQKKINRVCKKVYRNLQISSYARIDLRLTPSNEIVIIEVNPNPALALSDDFAQSALNSGINYDQLIQKILGLALQHKSN